jgi:hypothetical protein
VRRTGGNGWGAGCTVGSTALIYYFAQLPNDDPYCVYLCPSYICINLTTKHFNYNHKMVDLNEAVMIHYPQEKHKIGHWDYRLLCACRIHITGVSMIQVWEANLINCIMTFGRSV